ncbi:PP0621 family protein [Sulfuriferula sp. GW1]|uniref:PP0621 family protein n=1 Tax=Sulfuriferula sp. GW1 TaxID=3345111 RepID=UPI0039B118D0
MAKILLLLIIGGVIYWVIKSPARGNRQSGDRVKAKPPEDMVRCMHCGVNLPRSEAVLSRGEFFCGNEHRQLHQP